MSLTAQGAGKKEELGMKDWPDVFRAMLPAWARKCLYEDHEVGILTNSSDTREEVFCSDCSRGEIIPEHGLCPTCQMVCFATDGRSRCCDAVLPIAEGVRI